MAIKQPYSRLFVLVLLVVVFAIGCYCTSIGDTPSTNEELKVKTKQAQDKATETAKEAQEASETWAEWAKEKFSEGLGLKHDEAEETPRKASDMASDTAKKTKDKVQEVTSG